MSRRAQVTTFIVVGLVLLGIVGILFSISNSLKTETVTQMNSQDDRARFDAAVKIIRDCITLSSQQSLVTIAKQGGLLFEFQGGRDNLSSATLVADSFVAKGIVRNNVEMSYPTQTPFLPGQIRSAPLDPTLNQDVKSLGGAVVLPKLCDVFGPNKPANVSVIFTCEFASYGFDSQTIQNKLAKAIHRQTISCAQKSQTLLESLGNDVSSYFAKEPDVVFADSDVVVSYLFDTNVSARRSNFSYYETTVRVPVRYKRAYNFLQAVLTQDSKEILFDKTTDYAKVNTCNYPDSSACWDDGFTLGVTFNAHVDPNSGRVYDLVTIKDNKSMIAGKPLEFNTMVENRRPILVPVYDFFSFPNSTTHPDPEWKRLYDVYVKNGDLVTLRPFAYDFDEEGDLNYTYSGWKATDDTTFRTGTYTNQDSEDFTQGCTEFSPLQCFYWDAFFLNEENSPSSNLWQTGASSYLTGVNCDGSLYRCASYRTDDDSDEGGNDLGPHQVNITVQDRAGLSDYVSVAVIVGTD